ncbi:MAG: hypothetical protein OEY88_09095 [Candidatus Bathyarchaeota archaeon]|nr:hypothetical protein [Candidatus Bathyarchaeota archaeon]
MLMLCKDFYDSLEPNDKLSETRTTFQTGDKENYFIEDCWTILKGFMTS